MDFKNVQSGLLIGRWKFNFSVVPPRMKQHRVQDINPSSNHDNLDILGDLKAIQLVEQFQHCAPHFVALFSDFFQL